MEFDFELVTINDRVNVNIPHNIIDIIFVSKNYIDIDTKIEIPELRKYQIDEWEYKIAIDDLLHFSII